MILTFYTFEAICFLGPLEVSNSAVFSIRFNISSIVNRLSQAVDWNCIEIQTLESSVTHLEFQALQAKKIKPLYGALRLYSRGQPF